MSDSDQAQKDRFVKDKVVPVVDCALEYTFTVTGYSGVISSEKMVYKK